MFVPRYVSRVVWAGYCRIVGRCRAGVQRDSRCQVLGVLVCGHLKGAETPDILPFEVRNCSVRSCLLQVHPGNKLFSLEAFDQLTKDTVRSACGEGEEGAKVALSAFCTVPCGSNPVVSPSIRPFKPSRTAVKACGTIRSMSWRSAWRQ